MRTTSTFDLKRSISELVRTSHHGTFHAWKSGYRTKTVGISISVVFQFGSHTGCSPYARWVRNVNIADRMPERKAWAVAVSLPSARLENLEQRIFSRDKCPARWSRPNPFGFQQSFTKFHKAQQSCTNFCNCSNHEPHQSEAWQATSHREVRRIQVTVFT